MAVVEEALERIKPLIEAHLRDRGFELYDIKFFRAGKKSLLRLFIDREKGVTIDDCESVSRSISMLLDVEDFCATSWTLEVSSVGIDRPLLSERDFYRNRGHTVTVHLRNVPRGRPTSVRGIVRSCADGVLTLDVDGVPISLPLAEVARGEVEVDFG